MNDDLNAILESIRQTQANILARLERLERGQQETGTNELAVPAGWGYPSPTSPPSKFLQVRGGTTWMYDSNYEEAALKIWPDFQENLFVSSFANAYYYRGVVPYMYGRAWAPTLYIWEADTDFATYEECAQYMAEDAYFLNVELTSNQPQFPLCALAIRNNGTTGSTSQYLPITLNDREQSSFIYRDLRIWFEMGWWW